MTLTLLPITADELQAVLRQVAQLSGIEVTTPFPHLVPHLVHLAGAITIHGQALWYETDIDLRGIETRSDLATLIACLLDSFEAASHR